MVISWAVYVCAGSNIAASGFHDEMIVSEYTLYGQRACALVFLLLGMVHVLWMTLAICNLLLLCFLQYYSGDVELTNMQLKPEALNSLKLPVKVKAGFLGSVKLKVCSSCFC